MAKASKVSPKKKTSAKTSKTAKVKKSPIEITLPLPSKVETWGMNHYSLSPVFFPEKEEDFRDLFSYANNKGLKLTLRGGGCSYGDAATNTKGVVIDISKYNRILEFNSKTGIIKAESGVTIKQLWEFGIEKGYWPPVVSGTMFPTLGGALSMNIHGKNNFAVGSIGDHVLEFTFMTPNGKVFVCSRKKNRELFFAAISGFGMLGVFLNITIQLKAIYAGKMKVWPVVGKNLQDMFDYFEREYKSADYLVGWIDAFASGNSLGRGQIHKAVHLKKGEDPDFPENCKLERQNLPSTFLGIIPKSWMWLFMIPFANNLGMRLVNFAKFVSGYLTNNKPYFQGHAEYAFLLDYVPNWKLMYKPGSMIQYQSFIPKENAVDAFCEILKICQKRRIVTWLAVFKKHKSDPFLLTHALDGYSMAMDFPVTFGNRKRLWELAGELDEIVLKFGGKFYFAKDSTLRPETVQRAFPKKNLEKFYSLKRKLDPKGILETDLYRRITGTW
ncbi:FAD-binding oxidoreductase [Leptospira borgpetersenii]|uniref:FAD/FMN-containing dehydrogenase n=3 Tax=Leptospira TaxID=171 RepID=Q04SK6_LEPBJ|nr:FAD-binding oxidoreductase [Leptospira borgpetersenii]ABJ76114.1 FAD/FMN-containing dehydrogenase [Leptospira borgpetersenii serovar Hardjo-bovis str. JB197]ABJ79212.1 FAD/FMN-containing dehydrogenase [Leptospira borgpetersenii serovar Hardjo-bovis str. L550]AMX58521.1 FAD-binding protein [Leptospira borgpetersenii serovar Hardjo]AMX61774.1 FAD-binding protein [Leptospira borgpetersenii serovar Hardjo]AMX65018.1 FAD-binding protein [Leptospira borgpetersenii serovar Hardjo]